MREREREREGGGGGSGEGERVRIRERERLQEKDTNRQMFLGIHSAKCMQDLKNNVCEPKVSYVCLYTDKDK